MADTKTDSKKPATKPAAKPKVDPHADRFVSKPGEMTITPPPAKKK